MSDASSSLEEVFVLAVAGRTVGCLVTPVGFEPELSPRPFLHPVTTLGGTVVTDERPEDHRWHLGVSVALQDVGGVNFWGGRTYVRDQGYVWRDDHGHIRSRAWHAGQNSANGECEWIGPDGAPRLAEERTLSWTEVPELAAWSLDLAFELTNIRSTPVDLGSPGSNGRAEGGYGGFFWRLPATEDLEVLTPEAEGEAAVHGKPAPWLLVRGIARDVGRPYALVFAATDQATTEDPWFVRVDGYPGVGSSLAWTDPVRLEPGQSVRRSIRVVVSDEALDVAAAGRCTATPAVADRLGDTEEQ